MTHAGLDTKAYPFLYKGKSIDWTLILTRANQPLFFMCTFYRPEGIWLKDFLGMGCLHQMCIEDHGISYYIRSASEDVQTAEEAAKILLDPASEAKFKKWSETGIECLKTADNLVTRFKQGVSDKYVIDNYLELYAECEKIFFYATSLPFFILIGVERAMELGHAREKFEKVFTQFEPLRAVSKYPDINNHVFSRFFETAATLLKLPDASLTSHLTPEEMAKVMAGGALSVSLDELTKRKEWVASWVHPDTAEIFVTTDKSILTIYNPAQKAVGDVQEVKGKVAFKGKVRGAVRIIRSGQDAHLFKDGEILMAPSTNPELSGLMVRCSAIVTDEGGIACHAAIISRELKPCVIGTKNATKVFKDGDMVEVDAEKGIVKILK